MVSIAFEFFDRDISDPPTDTHYGLDLIEFGNMLDYFGIRYSNTELQALFNYIKNLVTTDIYTEAIGYVDLLKFMKDSLFGLPCNRGPAIVWNDISEPEGIFLYFRTFLALNGYFSRFDYIEIFNLIAGATPDSILKPEFINYVTTTPGFSIFFTSHEMANAFFDALKDLSGSNDDSLTLSEWLKVLNTVVN